MPEARSTPLVGVALSLAILAVWAITHRYGGIWHDAVLYAGQALYRLHPQNFGGDLFFSYGSQDSFSLFGPAFARLVSAVGLPFASFALMLGTQLSWLAAAAVLARRMVAGTAFWFCLLLIAVLPRTYGADEVFAYAETFVTARVVAEPLALAGLALLLAGRNVIGGSVLAAAAAFHPVIALPAVVAALFMLAPPKASAAVVIVGLAILGLLLTGMFAVPEPLQLMDGDWYRISVERSPFVFLDQWTAAELSEPLFWASVLYLAGTLATGTTRRFWFSVLGSGLLGFGLAALAARWPLALLVQMQTWRAAWLVKLVGIIACVWLVRVLLSHGRVGQVVLALLASCLVAADGGGGFVFALAALLYPLLRNSPRASAFVGRHGSTIIVCLGLATLPWLLLATTEAWQALVDLGGAYLRDFPRMTVLELEPPRALIAALGAVTLVLMLATRRKAAWRVAAGSALAFVVATAVFSWQRVFRDTPSVIMPFAEAPPVLRRLIPPGATTFIEGGHSYLWFALERASYASHHQAAGVIFSRATAFEARRRLNLLSGIDSPDTRLQWRPAEAEPATAAAVPVGALLEACSDPLLDYVLLRRSLADPPAVLPQAVIPVTFRRGEQAVTLKLFACKPLRA